VEADGHPLTRASTYCSRRKTSWMESIELTDASVILDYAQGAYETIIVDCGKLLHRLESLDRLSLR